MDYGLIGKSLKHSFSPYIHKSLWDADYKLCELDESEVVQLFKTKDFKGVNVTIPYKELALKICDEADENAKHIGCVNTVVNKNGRLYGYNTDYRGMLYSLKRAGISLENKNVLILGSGATSKTAKAAAQNLNAASISVVSRNGALNYRNVYDLKDTEIIINTTPVGMYPDNGGTPLDINKFNKLSGVMDVVYNPLRTRLILAAQENGIKTADGLSMLTAQAVYAANIFSQKSFTESDIENQTEKLYKSRENIVLIGMPGSGKTSIAKLIAKKTGRDFFDTDSAIENEEGKSIPEIFKANGEEYFRRTEARITKEISKKNGCVISTGGGCILNNENLRDLRQNGRLFLIERDINLLATNGRPLSEDLSSLRTLYNDRAHIYKAAADAIVENNGDDFGKTAERICEIYENTCDKRP